MLLAAATKVNVSSSRLWVLPANIIFQPAEIASGDAMVIPMAKSPPMVGVISDTHGLLRPEAKAALSGSDLIIHAGDVGKPEILDELKAIAPLFVVRGNVDKGGWANQLPTNEIVEFGSFTIYVLHNLHELDVDPDAARFDAVITGHTHKAHEYRKGKVLFLNPGSAGPQRFDRPITVARLHVEKVPWRFEIIQLQLNRKSE
jgi:putative phosphoesterase